MAFWTFCKCHNLKNSENVNSNSASTNVIAWRAMVTTLKSLVKWIGICAKEESRKWNGKQSDWICVGRMPWTSPAAILVFNGSELQFQHSSFSWGTFIVAEATNKERHCILLLLHCNIPLWWDQVQEWLDLLSAFSFKMRNLRRGQDSWCSKSPALQRTGQKTRFVKQQPLGVPN